MVITSKLTGERMKTKEVINYNSKTQDMVITREPDSSESSLNDLLCFDFSDKNDIGFTYKLQRMLNAMGFETESSASDEGGYSHSIDVENAYCMGQVHTSEGRIMAMCFEYTKEA